jgi:hypothetical protein
MKKIATQISFLFILTCFFSSAAFSQKQSKLDIALRYLEQNTEQWNLTPADITNVYVSDQYSTSHNGVTHIYFNQTFQNINVYNAIAGIHITPNGKVAFATNTFTPELASKVNATVPQISPYQAIKFAATHIGATLSEDIRLLDDNTLNEFLFEGGNISNSDIRVKLKLHSIKSTGEIRLIWFLRIDQTDSPDMWNVHVDAVTGDIIEKNNLTVYCSFSKDDNHTHDGLCQADQVSIPVAETQAAGSFNFANGTYNVVPFPSESPIHGDRELLTDPHDPEASPYGWHDTDAQEGGEYEITQGNNAHAYLDSENNNSSAGDEPQGGAELIFDFPFDQSSEPDTYKEAAITQLFYSVNFIHDFTFHYGFDEAGGNFQHRNYSGEGQGSDHVRAEGQDGSGTDNANFSTPSDGANPRMQMYLWNALGGKLLTVVEPLEISGEYSTGAANYGPDLTTEPIAGPVVDAYDGSSNPTLGCETIVNAEEVNGKIAMINRGDCFFEEKTLNAQAAGAIAVIICNFEDGTITMAGGVDGDEPTIPSVMLKNSDCQLFRQLMETGDVIVSLAVPDDGGPSQLDACFDNGIIAHEFGHGISNRLTGGPSQDGCLGNDEQMGEGWSDFFTLVTTVKPGDVGEMTRGVGNYVTKAGVNGGGIRRLPYTTNMNINDQTFDDIIGTTAPHPLGEVWTTVLWDLYWAMVDVYGFDEDQINGSGGNNMAIQLVMDGMKYQSCDPGFMAGREAIMVADAINNEGANECLIWEVFARRGFGYNASGGSVYDRNDGFQDFEVLPECIKELKITKEVTQLITAGDEITVIIRVFNHKEEAVSGVIVNDEILDGTDYINGSASGVIPDLTGNMLSFDLGDIAAGASKAMTYKLSTSATNYSLSNFYDGMEEGDDNWLFENLIGTDIWDITTDDPYTGAKSWFVPNTEQENDQTLFLLDPVLISGDKPVLRFYHKYITEPGIDGGMVEISIDGGENWDNVSDLIFKNQYRGGIAYQTFTIPNLSAYWGNSNGYKDTYIDLESYLGEYILVRFRFASDAEADGDTENGIGWYIDDFEIIDMINYNAEACVSSNEGDTDCAIAEAEGTIVNAGDPTAVSDPSFNQNITLFPNPADEVINISFSANRTSEFTFEVISGDGRVLSKSNDSFSKGLHNVSLNVSDIPTGFYFIKVSSANEVVTEKIIIN